VVGPLEGMRVLDLTRILAGPYCTMVLGDLGAEVIKIEAIPSGDDSRKMGPFSKGESYCFVQVNRNKRSVALDIRSEMGHAALLTIAGTCDVFVENFRPGTAARLGCGYEDIQEVRPDVIYCSISGFGQSGPYANRPAYDIITQGMTGFLTMTGSSGGPPTKFGIAANDIAGGTAAVQAILAAHIVRLTQCVGQYIDISLVEAGLAWTVWEAAGYFGAGELPMPTATRHRRSAPYQAFKTQDGYVTIGVNTDEMWRAFCLSVVNRPDWLTNPDYADQTLRVQNVDALDAELSPIFLAQTTQQWVSQLLELGIPAGPVYGYDQALADPQVVARSGVVKVEHPRLGATDLLASPLRLSRTPPSIRRVAPSLGEHSIEILREVGTAWSVIKELYDLSLIIDASNRDLEKLCRGEDLSP
jgi:crotonobetainyl-CoA:carnitine CoA-transferase CaiB-like acyl-CoA transferase